MATPEQPDSREQRTEARREALLEATVRAIGHHGADVSMEAIADEAGITKPILYRHFGDKQGLAAALTQRYLRELRASLVGVTAPDLRALTRQLLDIGIDYLEARPHLLAFIQKERGFEITQTRPGEHAERLTRLIAESVLGSEDESPRAALIAQGLGALINGTVGAWLRDPVIPREAFIDLMVDLIWDGLGGQRADGVEPRPPESD